MGGIGSGRRSQIGFTDTTDDYRFIDVRRWQRDQLLAPGQSFDWKWSRNGEVTAKIQVRTEPDRTILTYRYRRGGSEWIDKTYPVNLSWSPCKLGGQRPWFNCPATGCGRRVALLYAGAIFACRQCYRLTYPSQRESGPDRAARRADRIREKLGWEGGILNGEGRKPKGMHWKTFDQLSDTHHKFARKALVSMAEYINFLEY